MNYKETLQYIHNTPKFGRIPGNAPLRSLLNELGNPQDKLRYVHIAGTNGKGSAAIMMSEILICSGYKVGLFTSPYIEAFNERIKINNKMIPNDDLVRIVNLCRNIIEFSDLPVSEFALDTAVAFQYFSEADCDIVVLETGLGGRLDATNVIATSLVSVLMSIGPDHMQYLGNTISDIAREKCGIIKPDSYTVSYPEQAPEALAVITETCTEQCNKLISAQTPVDTGDNTFTYNGDSYTLGLSGSFQKLNAATVIEAIDVLRLRGFDIPQKAIRLGLKKAFNPARLEMLRCGIILDGAHNPPAISALCKNLKQQQKPVHLCIAMMEDKDIDSCIKLLADTADFIITTEIDMPRCASAAALSEKFAEYGVEATAIKNPINAVWKLINTTDENSVACVCGSLYLAGLIRKKFKNVRPYYVYIIRCKDNSLYTGLTTDVERRFNEHKSKSPKGAKYTRTHTAVSVEAVFELRDRPSASRFEAKLKALSKHDKERIIAHCKNNNTKGKSEAELLNLISGKINHDHQ